MKHGVVELYLSTPFDDTIVIYRGTSLQILSRIIHKTNDKEDGYTYDSVKIYNKPMTFNA